jgi:hypothetical protein
MTSLKFSLKFKYLEDRYVNTEMISSEIRQNHKTFFDRLGQHLGIKKHEDWYNITASQVIWHKGAYPSKILWKLYYEIVVQIPSKFESDSIILPVS